MSKSLPVNRLDLKNTSDTSHILDFFEKLTDTYREYKTTEVELEKINAQKEILIEVIKRKYDLLQNIFNEIFKEREESINKIFEMLDKGIEEDNKEIISVGLAGLSQLVSSSPFANIENFAKAINSNQIIEI